MGEAKTPEPTGQRPQEQEKETGVVVYHVPAGIHHTIRARVGPGQGRFFVNGTPIEDLMTQGKILRFESLLNVLRRERFKRLDIDLDIGGPPLIEELLPPVLTYAVTEALTNLLGRL